MRETRLITFKKKTWVLMGMTLLHIIYTHTMEYINLL